jgi:hypothetical protein
VGSEYYLYYAVSTFGSQDSAIGLATSSTLEPGSWTDHGATGVASSSSKPYNAIDPNLIPVGSNYYLNLGSFWTTYSRSSSNRRQLAMAPILLTMSNTIPWHVTW